MGASRKTIKKVLSDKFKKFIGSIDDESVRRAVKKDSFITGGSIVSLLLGEPINDFDVYFKTKDTAKAVAKYYVAKFLKDNDEYSKSNVTVYDSDEDDRFTKEDMPNPARIKVFVASSGMIGDASHELKNEDDAGDESEDDNGFNVQFMSSNAITLSGKVQIVLRFYGEPENVHKNYDFVHCMCYWESSNGNLVLPSRSLESILSKTLYYHGSLYPICSVIRTRKFIRRGWHISAGQYLKMCFQISDLDLYDIDVLEEQLTGVDQAYFQMLISACMEKKNSESDFEITSGYICHIIDKLFD